MKSGNGTFGRSVPFGQWGCQIGGRRGAHLDSATACQSARGQAHCSKTWRKFVASSTGRQRFGVLCCRTVFKRVRHGERSARFPCPARSKAAQQRPHSKTWRKFVASSTARQRFGVWLSSAAFDWCGLCVGCVQLHGQENNVARITGDRSQSGRREETGRWRDGVAGGRRCGMGKD
jgi:hypothetical protein